VADLELVKRQLASVDNQAQKSGGFKDFLGRVRDIAVAQVAVRALSKGFPDLTFGIEAAARKATLLTGALTAAAGAAGPLLTVGAGIGVGFATAYAGVAAFVGLVKPAFTSVMEGVEGVTKAQDAYNAAIAKGDSKAA